MIVILKQNTEKARIETLIKKFENMGLSCHYSSGAHTTILGIIGDTTRVDIDLVRADEIVEDVKRVSEPYKAVNRKFHPDDTIVRIPVSKGKEVCIGGGFFGVIAGPCSVECVEQIISMAKEVYKSGATLLRGGAFKPRTSPYSFQGLQAQGLELLLTAKQETGLPIVSEIMDLSHLELFRDVDVIQVGARNMQNFTMLKALGQCGKPILLKRGLANTIEEFLMSAEYIMAGGNSQIILCERGIRTFETFTRNTLDISAVPVLNHLSHLPVVVDPSHAAGIPWLIQPLSKASVAAGADGLMIEVHNKPSTALSDGAQSITPAQFNSTMDVIKSQVLFEGKKL
ncbi:MAG: 3-deoxy-7-phosphoheptulonate synthase [Oscillospiraceae bacterium]|nr:3-deoxy-7-phosphoheptulonate synthase [Oscillospiraceae bacterium]